MTPSLRQVLPMLPLIVRTTVGHTLGLTEMSNKWDLRMELVVRVIQSSLRNPSGPRRTITQTQSATLKDPGVKGNKWISRYIIPKPSEDDAKEQVFAAIDALKEGGELYTKPELVDVGVEWTGYRKDCSPQDPEPTGMSEKEKYDALMKEVTSDVVILYLHGGAYYLMDPATHREITTKLAKMTGGRAYSVRYRLAPKGPFPSALVDAFVSYLSLLHPPPGAPHGPVPADKIVISGDSAGANLSVVLLQLLLQLHRSVPEGQIPTVKFHGADVPVPLPAGVALCSPWCDLTSSLDSITRNAKYDYLPNSWSPELIPDCTLWPTDPPRADLFVDGSALAHQMVSPIAAKSWKGAPPVYFNWGDELLTDEGSVLACRMAKDGVTVIAEHFEAMPHVFAGFFPDAPTGHRCFTGWSKFCTNVVEKKPLKTVGTFLTAKTLVESDFKVEDLMKNLDLDETKLAQKMHARKEKAMRDFDERQLKRQEMIKSKV
jgi:acetyl esterase/lipase